MSNVINPPSYQENLNELIDDLKGMFPEDKFAVFNNDAKQLAKTHRAPLVVKLNDRAPTFSLPNASGEMVSSDSLLSRGALVITFYRGVWCPYCNLHLKLLQRILPEIKQAGAALVAISPMNPDNSKAMSESNQLEFEVLSDTGNKVARQFTKVFKNADESIKTMSELGYDFYSFYDDRAAELPVSGTFVIAPSGIVVFAESEGGDYRLRTEPRKILDALGTI